jgi:hypothetical protein
VGENTFETGRINKRKTAKALQGWQQYADFVNAFNVVWIFCFCYILTRLINIYLARLAIQKNHMCRFHWAKVEGRNHRGNGQHSHRQQSAPDNVIQEAAFSGFESPQNRDVKSRLSLLLLNAPQQAFQIPQGETFDDFRRQG